MIFAPANPKGPLIETHRGFNPRVQLFYLLVGILLLVLATGLGYRQLIRSEDYAERAKVQNQRRILIPGPRGNIYDREGRLLVGNRPRFAITLYLDELRIEFRREYLRIRKAYRESGDKDIPSAGQLEHIARYTVVQRYLDQVNRALGREETVDPRSLHRHYAQQRLLPYILLEDLGPEDYARLLEQIPVASPLQLYTSSIRYYPYGSAASHTLGYVTVNDDISASDDLPGADLTTFKMKGTIGRNGIEREFDAELQGQTGGSIHLVDPAGYRVEPPLHRVLPVQGRDIHTSLDIDLQLVAEKALADRNLAGAAVALDVVTGEVLVLANKPDFDLNDFSPRLPSSVAEDINSRGAWLNRAVQGLYPPGSTFKLVTALAGLRAGVIEPDSTVVCTGIFQVGQRNFVCRTHRDYGEISLTEAIEKSCNTFFYKYGIDTGSQLLAAEARRFGLHEPTGIELPFEPRSMLVPDPDWKRRTRGIGWFPGDTANMSIGQGDLALSPLQLATFIASVARGETVTTPTLLHDPARRLPPSAPLGLTPAQHAAFLHGMEAATITGTARRLSPPFTNIPGLRMAGKTGTAQKRTPKGTINFAWFVGFAPIENPRIAIAVMMEGDTPGEDTGGGAYAAPVAGAIFKTWHEKSATPPALPAPSVGAR